MPAFPTVIDPRQYTAVAQQEASMKWVSFIAFQFTDGEGPILSGRGSGVPGIVADSRKTSGKGIVIDNAKIRALHLYEISKN
jgi:hypothetical protein